MKDLRSLLACKLIQPATVFMDGGRRHRHRISNKGPLALIGLVVDRVSAFASPPQVIILTEPQRGGQLLLARVVGHIIGKKSQVQGTCFCLCGFFLITGNKSGCLAMEENSIFIILNCKKTYLFLPRGDISLLSKPVHSTNIL